MSKASLLLDQARSYVGTPLLLDLVELSRVCLLHIRLLAVLVHKSMPFLMQFRTACKSVPYNCLMRNHTAPHADLDVMCYICQFGHALDFPLRLSALGILLAGGNCGEVRGSLPPQ